MSSAASQPSWWPDMAGYSRLPWGRTRPARRTVSKRASAASSLDTRITSQRSGGASSRRLGDGIARRSFSSAVEAVGAAVEIQRHREERGGPSSCRSAQDRSPMGIRRRRCPRATTGTRSATASTRRPACGRSRRPAGIVIAAQRARSDPGQADHSVRGSGRAHPQEHHEADAPLFRGGPAREPASAASGYFASSVATARASLGENPNGLDRHTGVAQRCLRHREGLVFRLDRNRRGHHHLPLPFPAFSS